jgi:hypothetical protein
MFEKRFKVKPGAKKAKQDSSINQPSEQSKCEEATWTGHSGKQQSKQ